MIPPLRGLSHLDISLASGSDVTMKEADSLLGKRMADDSQKLDLSLTLHGGATARGKPKKGRKCGGAEASDNKADMVADTVAARTRRKTTTGHVASGNLTGPNEGSRQEP
jgi:hypothetical protein